MIKTKRSSENLQIKKFNPNLHLKNYNYQSKNQPYYKNVYLQMTAKFCLWLLTFTIVINVVYHSSFGLPSVFFLLI